FRVCAPQLLVALRFIKRGHFATDCTRNSACAESHVVNLSLCSRALLQLNVTVVPANFRPARPFEDFGGNRTPDPPLPFHKVSAHTQSPTRETRSTKRH